MTRTSKKMKKVLALLAVVIILSSIVSIPANATWNPTSKNRFGAWLGSMLLALNITMESTVAPIQQLYEYIADPVAQQVEYTYPATAWEDNIMDNSVIKIVPDAVVIDGVPYTDIWLSNEAAEKFRVNAFDFATAYSLASNTNGTFASGEGSINGVPAYRVGNVIRTQSLDDIPMANGDYRLGNTLGVRVSGTATNNRYLSATADGFVNRTSLGNYVTNNWPIKDFYFRSGGVTYHTADNPTYDINKGLTGAVFTADPFDFDYVASTIPPDVVLPLDTGMNLRVPSSTPGLQVFIENNIDYTEDNGKYIDFNLDPDVQIELEDLIDIIAPILVDLDIGDVTFTTIPDTPTPVVDTLLPDTYWSTLENKLDQIIQNIQSLTPDFSTIIQAINSIPSAISQGVTNITQSISNLGDQILKDIQEGPIKLLDKLIDVLRSLFFPILATLRGFLGIWNYVVTWMSNISAPFTWIMGLMAGTSPILVSPIYALIAGIIVIAVYRRFGR